MECTTVREQMLEALYGEAGEDTLRRVDEHLAVCAACRDEMAAFRRLRVDLKSYTLPALTPGRPRWLRPAWNPGLPVAAALLLAVGGASLWRVSVLERRLLEQDARHAQALAELQAGLRAQARPAAAAPAEAALVLRLEELVTKSEERQDQRLAASLRDLSERSEAQRRYDLARMSAGLSYLDGRTGQRAARTAELMGYVLQAAERK